METIRVLIADDHPVFRFGLKALLSATPDLEVAGEPPAVRDRSAGSRAQPAWCRT
jgi:DNA-binding NarL/FixJ family response regulator